MTTTINGTTITLSGTSVSAGFGVGSKYTNFYLTSTGNIGGIGLYASTFITATNNGEISASGGNDGVNLEAGGAVFNTGDIYTTDASTSVAINLDGAGSYLSNSSAGKIVAGRAGIKLPAGGKVYNAGVIIAPAVYAIKDIGGVVTNASSGIIFAGGIGVYLPGGTFDNQGGVSGSQGVEDANFVLNGSTSNTTTGLGGYTCGIVSGGLLTVANFGTISGKTADGVYAGSGTLTNGSALSTAADISGNSAGILSSGSLTLNNFGTVAASGTKSGDAAVSLLDGGGIVNQGDIAGKNIGIYGRDGSLQIVNGSAGDSGAQIYGAAQGVVSGTLTLTNFGTIETSGTATASVGVELGVGAVTNGSVVSTKALIEGYADGVMVVGHSIPIENFGTIRSTAVAGGGIGVSLQGAYGDTVTNGAATDNTALIQGYTAALYVKFTGSVVNLGTLDGIGRYGVEFAGSCQITNGSSADTAATIYGGRDAIDGLAGSDGVGIQNFGTVLAADVAINAPGSVTIMNGSAAETAALISSQGTAVVLGTGSAIANFGTIAAGGVGVMMASGTVTNGSRFSTRALIAGYGEGIYGTANNTTVANYGTIRSTNIGATGNGIFLQGIAGDRVTNGGASDTTALIQGYAAAISLTAGTIGNFGTLDGTGQYGVIFSSYARIVNGSPQDKTALIIGYTDGILGFDNAGRGVVVNYGSIVGTNAAIYMEKSATVTNGTGTDKTALLESQGNAVQLSAGGTIRNFGTIYSSAGQGVSLTDGGGLTNGSVTSIAATIESYGDAIYATGGSSQIISYGTIRVDGQGLGLVLEDGGGVINGGIHDGGALIAGDGGILITSGAGTVINFGTIEALGVAESYAGVFLTAGGGITNGAAGKALGSIVGQIGVQLTDGGAVTNFGTIEGDAVAGIYLLAGGTVTNFGTLMGADGADAVDFIDGGLLVAEAGADFIGAVIGGGGTLEVLGIGTLSGLLNGGGVTVSGSLPTPTAFTDFHTVDVGGGASFAVAGNAAIAAGETLIVAGTLSDAGTLAITGSLGVTGTIAGTGTLALAGGATLLGTGAAVTIAQLAISGGTTTLGANLTYAGGFTESAGTLALGGKILTLTGAAGFTGGTITGTGNLTTKAATTLAALSFIGAAGWLNYGTVTETGALTLGGTGAGGTRLSNESGAIFDITANTGIAIATGGSGNIVNGGLIEKTAGTGTSTIAAAIANNGGTIAVTSGTLDLSGAITYTGKETIGTAGTLKFDGSVAGTQTISFAGTTGGELVLNDPSGTALSFAGTVAGLGGSDTLDLASFAYVTGTKPGWTQNGTSGTLTVTEGGDTAKITLFGQYVAAGFSATKDASGDTLITYTTPAQVATLVPPHH